MSFESGVFPDAGIGILVRNSTCLPPSVNFNSEASLVPDLHSDRVQSVDDRNWSWGSLRVRQAKTPFLIFPFFPNSLPAAQHQLCNGVDPIYG